MTDPQIIQRLRNLSTDAYLSGDEITARILAEAAARLTELSIMRNVWHPSMEEANRGVRPV